MIVRRSFELGLVEGACIWFADTVVKSGSLLGRLSLHLPFGGHLGGHVRQVLLPVHEARRC